MPNPSSEALMISALLKNADVHGAQKYGVSDRHFRGFSNEYQWLQSYHKTYGSAPSLDAFFHQFPDFPFRDHSDLRYAADEVLRDFAQFNFHEMVVQASQLNANGDVRGAYESLQTFHYTPTSAVPTSIIKGAAFLDAPDIEPAGIGLPWETPQYDTAGIGPGQFWTLAARLNQGKSALLCAIAAHAVLQGKKVIYYSLEMTEAELRTRIHVLLAAAKGEDWLKANDIKHRRVDILRYREFVKSLETLEGEVHVHTPKDGPVSPAVIASRSEDYDLAVVDYLTLMQTDKGEPVSSDWRTLTQVTNRIKQVTLATGTPVLAAAQINREGDHGDGPPSVGKLAQGDSIGQDSDVVITTRLRPQGVAAVASLEKNRHGPAGKKWWMQFSVNDGQFDEVTEERADYLQMTAEERAEAPKLRVVRD